MDTFDQDLYRAYRDRRDRAYRGRRDDDALRRLVERPWAPCYRAALAITGDPGAAEDAAQHAFVRLVAAGRRGRTLDPVGGWLRTVAVTRRAEARFAIELVPDGVRPGGHGHRDAPAPVGGARRGGGRDVRALGAPRR